MWRYNMGYVHVLLLVSATVPYILSHAYVTEHSIIIHVYTCCCCCWAVLLAATCADAMARACCRREEVAWRLATVMAALLGRIGGGPYSQHIQVNFL